MIEINTKHGDIKVCNQWEELTPQQFTEVIAVIAKHAVATEFDYVTFRLELLVAISGYKRSRKRLTPDEADNITYNLFILSEKMNFALKPVYLNPELMDVLPEQLRHKLNTTFPEDLTDYEDIKTIERILPLLKYSYELNLNCRKNILPVIQVDEINYYGPHFEVDTNGVCEIDMRAEEYIDALDYITLYSSTHDRKYLEKTAAILYRTNRAEYNTIASQKAAANFTKVPDATLQAVFYVFLFIQEYFRNHQRFSLFFTKSESPEKNNTNGLINSLYQLSELGYGSRNELSALLVTDFFNILYKNLKDSVLRMRDAEITNTKIAEKLGFPINVILSFQ